MFGGMRACICADIDASIRTDIRDDVLLTCKFITYFLVHVPAAFGLQTNTD